MSTVNDIMQTEVIMATEGMTTCDATKLMKKKRVTSLVIVNDEEAVGIVTGKDILYKVIAAGKDCKKVSLQEIMSTPLVVIDPSASLSDAAEAMTQNNIKKLIVIEEDSGLVGIVSASDLLAHSPEFLNILVNLDTEQKQKMSS